LNGSWTTNSLAEKRLVLHNCSCGYAAAFPHAIPFWSCLAIDAGTVVAVWYLPQTCLQVSRWFQRRVFLILL